jgi:hypothetical protein
LNKDEYERIAGTPICLRDIAARLEKGGEGGYTDPAGVAADVKKVYEKAEKFNCGTDGGVEKITERLVIQAQWGNAVFLTFF